MSATRHTVVYGGETVPYTLERRPRRTMSITVHPDLRVTVVAPETTEDAEIEARMRKRARWVVRQRRQFLAWMPQCPPRTWKSGETHRYLGRQYRLRVIQGELSEVKLRGRFFEITVQNPGDTDRVRDLLEGWMREKAKKHFTRILDELRGTLKSHELWRPRVRIRKMSKRWGSCTPDGVILLNPELIKTPTACIEYVVAHEICHLKYPHHGKAFFNLLDAVLPGWKQRKARLERSEL